MQARALMLQGTGSDVGKSLLVAGLARVFTRRGLQVRPFKPQNMSNNAAVTADGGEIGRAQALQARAAHAPLSVHMNPVLLKPQSDVGAQLVVQGRVVGNTGARDYQAVKSGLLAAVLDSFRRVAAEADLVLVEGAGSASEVNLRADDIANMGFARAAEVPVVLVGDIDRGGVIASLVGTRAVIDPEDTAMIAGFIVNRFRGDPSLFADGMRFISKQTGWPALGLVPHFPDAIRLPAEDALDLPGRSASGGAVKIVVLAYPHLANFDDVDPLCQEPDVEVVFLRPGQPIPGDAALVILPGSKATIADLVTLREAGWEIDLKAHLRRGGHVLGVCGGYQMLGRRISDPEGIEGPPGSIEGLGLLDAETILGGDKILIEVTGRTMAEGVPFKGYEMHVGRTTTKARPLLDLDHGGTDGAIDQSGRVAGCYIHGLMSDDRQRRYWLQRIGATGSGLDYDAGIDETLERLADHLEEHVDCTRLLEIARVPRIDATK